MRISVIPTRVRKPDSPIMAQCDQPWSIEEVRVKLKGSLEERIGCINKVFCRHNYIFDDYLEYQEELIKAKEDLIKTLINRINLEDIPQFVSTFWFNDGVAYGEVKAVTLSHWTAPILGDGVISLFVEWDRLRNGEPWGNQWIWDMETGHDLLTPIDKNMFSTFRIENH